MFQFIFDLKRFGEQKSVSDLKESNKTIKNFDESL
jgi:flagellar biosynthesis chaperone FliJ